MKERPILWSAPMVLALLAGRKTQTRRIVNPKLLGADGQRPFGWGTLDKEHGITQRVACPYGEPGDRLWGRETFSTDALGVYPCPRAWYRADFTKHDDPKSADHVRECNDGKKPRADCFACATDGHGVKWKPSIFMFRKLSRLLHEVTAVRVERLQDITEADARAEGITEVAFIPDDGFPPSLGYMFGPNDGKSTLYPTRREAYLVGWDTINGKGSAAKNPWVWVVSFKAVST